jgi:hypothetical protein
MPSRPLLEEITLASLIDIQRYHVHFRVVIPTVPSIAVQETVHNVLGMEIFLIRSDHGRKPWTFGYLVRCHGKSLMILIS